MIRILGAKRVLTLAVLLALNILAGAGVYLYIVPQKQQKQSELANVRSQTSTLQSDISRMQIEFEQLAEQQGQFDALRNRGFFGNQQRRVAEIILERIQKEAGVVSAVVNIQPGAVEDNEEAQKAEHRILVSPVSLKISAVDDVDVFRYLYLLRKFFPGHLQIEKIDMARVADVSGPVLRGIASNENPVMVTADIDLKWRTMIPQKDIIGAPLGEVPPQ